MPCIFLIIKKDAEHSNDNVHKHYPLSEYDTKPCCLQPHHHTTANNKLTPCII